MNININVNIPDKNLREKKKINTVKNSQFFKSKNEQSALNNKELNTPGTPNSQNTPITPTTPIIPNYNSCYNVIRKTNEGNQSKENINSYLSPQVKLRKVVNLVKALKRLGTYDAKVINMEVNKNI